MKKLTRPKPTPKNMGRGRPFKKGGQVGQNKKS